MFPNFLVLAGHPPDQSGVGAILLSQILKVLPKQNITLVTFMRKADNSFSTGETLNITPRFEYVYKPIPGFLGNLISLISHTFIFTPYLNSQVKKIVNIGRRRSCEAVLVVLEYPSLIFIASTVANRLNLPLYCFVMDDPQGIAKTFGYEPLRLNLLMGAFEKAIKNCYRLAVAGESMQSFYHKKYGKESVIFRQGYSYHESKTISENTSQISSAQKSADFFIIGFTGTLSALDSFEQLLLSLDRRNWKIADRRVIVRFAGPSLRLASKSPRCVEYYGWLPMGEMVNLMRECTFLYLPQPFTTNKQEVTELSFPNKLCSYVSTGVPIALHTPSNGSLISFFNRFPCGPISNEFIADNLLDLMEATANNNSLYTEYQKNCQEAFRVELNSEKLQERAENFFRKSVFPGQITINL
ncbi:MAG: hypothetical protein ACKPE3_11675 [Sphaerospermopsis kisseleviana]|jgi:hypothetical protein